MKLYVLLLAAAQLSVNFSRDSDRIDAYMVEGRYNEAITLLNALLRPADSSNQQYEIAPLLVKSATLAVEIGRLDEAERELVAADAVAAREQSPSRSAAIARERAALLLAKGDFPQARTAAHNAVKLSRQYGYYKIRIAYAQSLEALAALELNDTEAAAKLTQEALKAIPKRRAKQSFFAPRILYAAARVASRQGDHATAETHCRRGLAMHPAARDASLGHLALAEILLAAGNREAGRQAVETSLRLTRELFGDQHQDAARARLLLAQP